MKQFFKQADSRLFLQRNYLIHQKNQGKAGIRQLTTFCESCGTFP
jgi:hypothetical protein